MKGIINLPRIKRQIENLEEVAYCDITTAPNKLIIDLNILKGDYEEYLDDIASNLGFTRDYLDKILSIPLLGQKNGIYRISIPIIRLRKGAYCTNKISISIDDINYGDLIINDTFAQFPIKINNERHNKKLIDFLIKLESIINESLLDTDNFANICPSMLKRPDEKINKFCTYCINTKNMMERRMF